MVDLKIEEMDPEDFQKFEKENINKMTEFTGRE